MKKLNLSNQISIITLISLAIMIISISIILPKSLEPFYEQTVYNYLEQPLKLFEKENLIDHKHENVVYIIYNRNGTFISNNYKEVLNIEDYSKILKYVVDKQGKFTYKTRTYYYKIKGEPGNKIIAITNDRYIKLLKRSSLGTVIPIVIITFIIILVLLLIWSKFIATRLEKLKLKVDNINNEKFKIVDNKYEFDDEIMLLDKTIDKMKKIILSQDKYKSELYQNISHDFKTPITVIKSYIEAYNDGIENYENVINVSEEQIKKLENKVKTLLELNKITYLQNSYKNDKKIKISAIVKDIVERYKFIKSDLNYEIKCVNEDILYNGTLDIWESIIDNILSNFIRYAKENIKVVIKENQIVFFNDGNAIDKDIIDDIFKPFKKGKKGESGIGLSIVKSNCDLIGYKVIAKNKRRGVEFIISKN